MRIFVDAASSCFKPADGRLMQNCLRFMRGCRVVRLANQQILAGAASQMISLASAQKRGLIDMLI
jgi:hypothetical protein